MKRKKSIFKILSSICLLFVLAFGLIFIIGSCGGGGDGDIPPTTTVNDTTTTIQFGEATFGQVTFE